MRRNCRSKRRQSGCDDLPLHPWRVRPGARGRVHLRAVVVRPLASLEVLRLAAPRLQRGRLQRATVRERKFPWIRALRVHRVQVRGRVFVRLSAGEEEDAWYGGRHVLVEALEGPISDLLVAGTVGRLVAGEHHVRLQQRAEDVDALVEELRVERVEHARGDVVAALDRVRAILEYLGLDYRDDSGLLAQRRVACECVSVRPDAVVARQLVGDRVGRAPLGEPRAEGAILLEPHAQPVEALGDRLPVRECERLRALVDLDARHDSLRREQLRERRPVGGRLPDRLIEEDDAADVLLHPRRREEHLAVCAPMFLRRFEADRGEALLDRAVALVRGEEPLPRGDERLRCLVQLIVGHALPLVSDVRPTDYSERRLGPVLTTYPDRGVASRAWCAFLKAASSSNGAKYKPRLILCPLAEGVGKGMVYLDDEHDPVLTPRGRLVDVLVRDAVDDLPSRLVPDDVGDAAADAGHGGRLVSVGDRDRDAWIPAPGCAPFGTAVT